MVTTSEGWLYESMGDAATDGWVTFPLVLKTPHDLETQPVQDC